MRRKLTSILLTTCMILMSVATTRAGGALESIDITGAATFAHSRARIGPGYWNSLGRPQHSDSVSHQQHSRPDSESAWPCISDGGSSHHGATRVDGFLEQHPDVLHPDADCWYKSNLGLVGFDMINELSFRTAANFGAIASSPSTNLIADTTLVNGQLIDGDADADVSSAITTAQDVDNDGDIEFPAGFYKAGTILDNDVQFNTKVSNGFRFTVDPAQFDTVGRSVDLNCVAVHEFGHSFGLSHVLNNQNSATDGDGSTMFPFIATTDPDAERQQGVLSADDIAYASFYYQEGSAASGPGALQSGDVPFTSEYGLISGELRHGVLNQPIAGGNVYAIDRKTDAVVAGAFSGTTNLSFNPLNGGLFFVPTVADAIPNGNYVIPVPKGNYSVNVEATDGSPVAAANISFTCQIGNFLRATQLHRRVLEPKQ